MIKIVDRMRELLATNSIYRRKAIKIKFRNADGKRLLNPQNPSQFDPSLAPKFINLGAKTDEPIFRRDVETQLQTSLYNPILFTDRCIRHGIPLKRGVLLEGVFGTGKTLTAAKLARMCVEHGWTFIYLENVADLDIAIGLATMYEPAVVFAEDIDRTMGGNRDQHMDRILNMIDGVDSKIHKIMVVLTTNDLDIINPAFIRPGRIDAIIQLQTPDAEAMVRIGRTYSKDAVGSPMISGSDADLERAFLPLSGANAAFGRAAVDTAKLAALPFINDNKMIITPNDISAAITSMLPHVHKVHPELSDGELEESNVVEVIGSKMVEILGINEAVAQVAKKAKERKRSAIPTPIVPGGNSSSSK